MRVWGPSTEARCSIRLWAPPRLVARMNTRHWAATAIGGETNRAVAVHTTAMTEALEELYGADKLVAELQEGAKGPRNNNLNRCFDAPSRSLRSRLRQTAL